MKKIVAVILAALLALCALGVPTLAEDQGLLGRLTKLNVDEDTLNAEIAYFFDYMPFSGYKYFDTLDSMVMALQSGSISGLAMDEFTKDYLISRADSFAEYINPVETAFLSCAMMLREDDAELCDSITAAIRDMQAEGTLDALKKQYIDDVIAGEEPEAVTPERFEGAQTLKVALTGDRPPMDYFSEAGEPVGFNTAIVSEVGRRLGLNIEFVSVDSGARAVSLASGDSDVVFWSENGNFENREGGDVEDQPEGTVITEPYLTGQLTYVVLATSPLAESDEN